MLVLEFHVVRESGLKQHTSMHLDVTLEIETLALTTIYSKREPVDGAVCVLHLNHV